MVRGMSTLASIPGIVDVELISGRRAKADGATVDLVIEMPHGATRTADYDALAARLTSPLPEGLVDFFHANTDAGAPELALKIAEVFVATKPTLNVAVLRCRIPRTFIDCNRQLDASAEDFKAGKVSPGLMPWITSPEDRALLRDRYDRYTAVVRDATGRLGPDGAMLLLHTYAPRTVDVEVDLQIVENLRAAYRPEVEPTWPMRPELDVIGKALDGTSHAPEAVVTALRHALRGQGLSIGDSATYPMHPSTMAYEHVMARPGRTLCLEVRRDLLADPYEPFAELRIAPSKVEQLALPIAAALRRWW